MVVEVLYSLANPAKVESFLFSEKFPCIGNKEHLVPREGMIIEWHLKWQFHDVRIDVLTTQTGVRELDDDDDDDNRPFVVRL